MFYSSHVTLKLLLTVDKLWPFYVKSLAPVDWQKQFKVKITMTMSSQ